MVSRRAFLVGVAGLLLWPARSRGAALPDPTRVALDTSRFVYVSPLRQDGAESTCHGEVWYAWLDGRVVLITSRDGWKARALARGLDRARVWVGDYGRWKSLVGRNEEFRQAPRFDARASRVADPALLERLLVAYERKYPEEIEGWRERFQRGFASGERVLLAYEPL